MTQTQAKGPAMFRTTAGEETDKHAAEVVKGIDDLQDWLGKFKKELREWRKPGQAIPAGWATTVMEKAQHVLYEVAMANGAVLVRGTIEDSELKGYRKPRQRKPRDRKELLLSTPCTKDWEVEIEGRWPGKGKPEPCKNLLNGIGQVYSSLTPTKEVITDYRFYESITLLELDQQRHYVKVQI